MGTNQNQRFLAQHGRTLLNAGFPIVPIKLGTKYPAGLSDWENTDATPEHLQFWLNNGFSEGGVGVLCREFPAVDIDVEDERAAQFIQQLAHDFLGSTPVRIGNAPKRLLLYRTDEPFTKMATAKYVTDTGEAMRVEVMGEGQQVVLQAVHPDTGRPYVWDCNLDDLHPDDLPVVSLDTMRSFIAKVETFLSENGTKVTRGKPARSAAEVAGLDALAAAKPPLGLRPERLRADLAMIEADDYETWCTVGMALWHEYNGSTDGLELWREWSSNSVKFDNSAIDNKWSSFKPDVGRAVVTCATIIKMANEIREENRPFKPEEIPDDPLTAFLDRYCYVSSGDLVADLMESHEVSVCRLNEFKNYHANAKVPVPAPTASEPDRVKPVPVATVWLTHESRLSAKGLGYSPGKPRLYRDEEGAARINTFRLPPHEQISGDGLLQPFFDHMAYILPIEKEREWFIDWLAFNVQFPHERSKVTPLHVSAVHGTGRGWIVKLLSSLLGAWNAQSTDVGTLTKEGAFTGFLNNSLVCTVDEVYEPSTRFSINDRVRNLLTEDRLQVNVKYGSQCTQRVYTNFFLMSNHTTDAMVLTPEDRRINVLTGADYYKPDGYYDELYKWLKNPRAIAQCYRWLMRRHVSFKGFQRSMDTPARRAMIEASQTDTESVFRDFINTPPAPVMLLKDIKAQIMERIGGDPMEVDFSDRQLGLLLKRNGRREFVKRNGRTERVWVLDRQKEFNNEQMRDILNNYESVKAFL